MAAIGRPRRRGIDLAPDDPIVRGIEDALTSPHIDPLYRRQMRTQVLNRYVAAREGHLVRPATAHPTALGGVMGRLGRACLYTSVALAGSAAGVFAASQTALPGDMLYGVKLRIDALRLEAAPADLRTAVAEYIVGERLDELTVLAADGEWARATEAAEAAGAQAQALAVLLGADPQVEARIHRHLEVLAGLIEGAPPAARDAITHAMAVSDSALGPAQADLPHGNSGGNANGPGGAGGSGNSGNGGSGSGNSGIGGAGSGGNGGSSGGAGNDNGGAGAGGPGDPTPTEAATPHPSPTASDAGKRNEPNGGSGNDDAANGPPESHEVPSPTPRASRPPQAQGQP